MNSPEKRQTVAIQGSPGSFSHAAALSLYGRDIELLHRTSFEELFDAVSDGTATHGIVPIENTLAGSVHRNYDLLSEHSLQIVGETMVRVRLCLIAPQRTQLSDLRRVYSHPVALAQCRRFFAEHAAVKQEAAFDTAGGVRDVLARATGDEGAIGSVLAAGLYRGAILQEDLEDHEENYTRFFAVARAGEAQSEGSKVSIVFSLPNNPGILYRALGVFASRGVDLTKLESRPIPGRPWEYLFYMDCTGPEPDKVEEALTALDEMAVSMRVLGRYEAA